MPTATYALYVDWANDGSFATGGDDISADVLSATIERGFDNPLARYASVGRATFLLRNANRQYSPEVTANALPRRPVKFDMTYSAVTVTLFRGFVESLTPEPDFFGGRTAVLECVDALALLDLGAGTIGVLQNVTADAIINAVVNAVYTPPSTAYQKGVSVFPISADQWGLKFVGMGWSGGGGAFTARESVNAAQKIADVATSDWGRFFVAKNGAPTFKNRHAPIGAATALTVGIEMLTLDYRKGVDSVLNDIAVTARPRTVGTTFETLAQQTRALAIEPSASATVTVRFTDPNDNTLAVGGLNVQTPVATTDYTATEDDAGLVGDLTASVSATMTAYSDRATVTLTNAHATKKAYVQALKVRGYAVRVADDVTLSASDSTSIGAYQRRSLSLDAPLMSTAPDGQRLAEHLLAANKDPRAEVRNVTISGQVNATYLAACRDLELGDKVVLTEYQTGLSGYAGHILKMRHQIEPFEHRLSFDLEKPYDPGTPFRLDTSALNSGHLLIY